VTFRVDWTPSAQRDLSRLSPRVVDAILTFAEARLAINPLRMSKPLRGEYSDLRSARNGDYRLLIRVDAESQTIFVRRVDHRAHVYRRL